MQTADVVVSDPTGEPVPACPEATITWTDPVTGKSGYLVIDRLVRGVASGGMRMREGCTFDEVRRLAASMSLKEALHYVPGAQYLPLGGAKGGLDCDPASPEAPGVLYRFFAFIKPYLETHWATGDDLGTSAAVIDDTLARLGVDGCIGPALALTDDPDAARERFEKAQAIDVGGIGLGELVGGCGVAEAALTALDRGGLDRTAATAVVQGFGDMGGATARFLRQAGVRVIAVADAEGTVANPDGLDVEEMLASRLPRGVVDRTKLRPGDLVLPGDRWLDIKTDILVPAATSNCIDLGNQHRISCRYVVEAANLPVTADAERALTERGIVTLPDVVVNSATNAWWWWTVFGDVAADAEAAFGKVRTSLRALVTELLLHAEERELSPRRTASLMAEGRFREMLAAQLADR